MNDKIYDYVIVGGGIAGCSVAYELSKYNSNILLLEKNSDIALEASGAAGAFLSPLLGKPNYFKDLVNTALVYSTKLYKDNFSDLIDNCGTVRIPKDEVDDNKFTSYKPYIDFDYNYDTSTKGYDFSIGSVVQSYKICNTMIKNIDTKFNCNIKNIERKENIWLINDEIKAKNIILTTGYDTSLLNEKYIKIRPVWGRRIDIKTTTLVVKNYHKACSISKSKNGVVSIGATHHRDIKEINDNKKDTEELLYKASDILKLENIEVVKEYCGARASSFDYLPIVGKVINSKKTIEDYPYLKNGTKVPNKLFSRYDNMYILNGVGGRGFVLSPYLAKVLVDSLVKGTSIDEKIKVDRLFMKNVKRNCEEN